MTVAMTVNDGMTVEFISTRLAWIKRTFQPRLA